MQKIGYGEDFKMSGRIYTPVTGSIKTGSIITGSIKTGSNNMGDNNREFG